MEGRVKAKRSMKTCHWCGRKGTRGFSVSRSGKTECCSATDACRKRLDRFANANALVPNAKGFAREYRSWLKSFGKLWDKTYDHFADPETYYNHDDIEAALKLLTDEAKRLGAFQRKMMRALVRGTRR